MSASSSSSLPLPTTYVLPDILSLAPPDSYTRVNPNYATESKNSKQWFNSYNIFPEPKKRLGFDLMDFPWLSAAIYVEADAEKYRLMADFMQWFFAYDDVADDGELPEDGRTFISDVLHGENVKTTTFTCGKMFADFWSRVTKCGIAPGAARRILLHHEEYLRNLENHVSDSSAQQLETVEEYVAHRVVNIGMKSVLAMGEFSLGLDIPDEVFDHPLIKKIEDCGIAVTAMTNDVYSYNKEQAQGDSRNIITIAMRERQCTLQESFDYVGELIAEQIHQLNSAKASLPTTWGGSTEIDAQVARYIRICEDCTFGSCRWSLRCPRYFGSCREEVARTLVVELLAPGEKPPRDAAPPPSKKTCGGHDDAGSLGEASPVTGDWRDLVFTGARQVAKWVMSTTH